MEHLQLAHYIEKELNKGVSRDTITQILLKAGYSEELIKECFEHLSRPESAHETKPHIPCQHRNMWIIGVVLLLIIGGTFVALKISTDEIVEFVPTPGKVLSGDERQALFNDIFNNCIQKWMKVAETECIALATDVSECPDQECRDQYYMYKAMAENDSSVCDQISGIDVKVECERNAESICSDSRCVAYLNKDVSYCAHKDDCEDGAYLTIAQVTKNTNDCDMIKNSLKKSDCINKINAVSS